MKIERTIELLHRSSYRMMRVLKLVKDNELTTKEFRWFLKRETWLHLRLSLRLWFKAHFTKLEG